MYGVRNLNELAADDAAVEAEINRTGGNALRLGLHAYAFHADELTPADGEEELANRRALTLPSWFLPVTVVLICIIALALGV